MKESLTICPRCGGDACHKASTEQLTVWTCFGCGFTSNTTITEENLVNIESVIPQLYLDIKFQDPKGHYWYPSTVILEDKSMVFVDGKSAEDWKWAAVQSKDGKSDMTTKQEYEQHDFMEALDYIGYFEKQK
jgi:hypothetical protein